MPNLQIIIDPIDDNLVIPLADQDDTFQVRSDGIYLNGNLYLWEKISVVYIVNEDTIKTEGE